MARKITRLGALCAAIAAQGAEAAVSFAIPNKAGTGAQLYAPLDPAPVGISFEFFAFPSYFTNVTATKQCLANWKDLTGVWPPIRIGGTTQDRASYDSSTSAYVVYSVANPADAPATLTFGPKFMTLAGTYPGSVVVGLNRGKNNIDNTIAAAKVAVSEVTNLLAIELGNEPEYYPKDGQPIASGTWNPSVDAASQVDWSIRVGSAVGKRNIIQAGNWNQPPPEWGAAQLIASENATASQYIRHYAHHNYPGGDVQKLQSHSQTSSNVRSMFAADVAAVKQQTGKEYVLGETNSVSGGGAANVSPTFGAALWTMDYALRAAAHGISRVYFHHGTVGNCQYCFWGRYSMGAPYYGATAAVALAAGASSIAALDAGTDGYAAYVTFDAAGAPLRALLYNSDYYAGGGAEPRSSQQFTLTGLRGDRVRAKRLTAASSLSRADRGNDISFGGQYWVNGTCVVGGEEVFETVEVAGGRATFDIKAAEALLVYL
ncbi:glycoside hydrolase family 79 protein [Thermothelomyces thermophilus ATCC 42464]|uniref:Glycoside hydrolase family 79 protein n=1 Tax=Thermothelomyces thermophilus (strain ATCC 42464 / BCRC 31852 / DSM 1799) TaxID=573729 RepID=G2QJT2_THET4|nr:glycoside hydrolase family 79 protein [Thermothelomyces thermophilus ATCC 42464]AEO59838.1 glycoside hydrolase family 79 protein [Thermothelomyces thermophilus ATCC 42464]